MATITNPSGQAIVIPGHGDQIYGNYWYRDDQLVSAPACGTGFWDTRIEIPAGQSAELRVPVPRVVKTGERYTIAVVYGGLGSSTAGSPDGPGAGPDWMRNPDRALNCRKVEADVILPAK